MGLVSELRRRNVFRVAIAYVLIAWVILEAGDVLAPALHLPEWVVSALVFFLVLGFPLALVFAWAFELTPEGIKLEKHVDRSKSIARLTGRKLDYVIIAVLAIALVFFAFDEWVLEPARNNQPLQVTDINATEPAVVSADEGPALNTVAVLAFADMSPDADQQYFSDGIAEEILNALSHIPELEVKSRSSSFSFKGKGLDIPSVARQLGVASVLDGSVRKSGESIRVTAQLIDARTDRHVWSETYDRELEDIFVIQDEIAAAVVSALRTHLGLNVQTAPKMAGTTSVDAYQLYLQGRYFWRRRNAVDLFYAEELLQQAIATDPEYADAMTALAATYAVIPAYVDLDDPLHYYEKASEAAQSALEIDPAQAEAHAVLSVVSSSEGRWAEAFRYIEKAIELDPQNATTHHWAYISYISAGRLRNAHREITEAYRLDPLNAAIAGSLAWSFSVLGDFESAINMLEVSEDLGWGDFALPHIALNHALKGDRETAAELYASFGSTRDFANFDWAPSFLEALENPQHAEIFAEAMVTAVIDGRASPISAYPLLVLVGSEKFKDVLEMDTSGRGTYIWALWYVSASGLRNTSAFHELVSEIGLLQYWRESNQWPDLCRPVKSKEITCN